MKAESNPKRYRELSAPYESDKLAEEMLNGFFDAVSEARIKFKVPDVLLIAQTTTLNAEGEEVGALSQVHFGDWTKAEGLAAYAYGRAQVDRENYVKRMLTAKRRTD